MPAGPLQTVLQHIRKCIGASVPRDQSDGQLLERFLAQRDQAAFAALVGRHGDMVLGVCRRLLRDPHEAEDAFQATFLVLVRKARSIVRRESVGSWLYGVAYRIALRSRALAQRRQKQDSEVENVPAPETSPAGDRDELRPLLDEEISRLPEKYRQPVVLCYFEGKPYEEAARLLGWPAGTVSGRLARARAILHRRLTSRGVTLASAFPVVLSADQRVSAGLLDATVRAASHYLDGPAAAAATISPPVATLAEGMVHAMFLQKLKLGAALVTGLLVLSAGVAAFSLHGNAGEGPDEGITHTEVTVKDGLLPKGQREGEVVAVQFARDGKTLVVVRSGTLVFYNATTHEPAGIFGPVALKDCGSAVIYDATTHEERSELLADFRIGPFRRLELSPDGKLAVIDKGPWQVGGVKVYNLAAKKEIGTLEGPPSQVTGLAFAPDGKTVACAGGSGIPEEAIRKEGERAQWTVVQLWDIAPLKFRIALKDTGASGLAFSPGGKFLATSGTKAGLESGFVKIWDAGTGEAVATLTDKEFFPRQPVFSPDGKKLLVCTKRGIQSWDVAARKRDWMYPRQNDTKQVMDVSALAYSPDGKLVATGDYSGAARVWDAATGEERDRCQVTEAYVTALAFAPDSQALAIGSGHYFNDRRTKLKFDDYPARLWKLKK